MLWILHCSKLSAFREVHEKLRPNVDNNKAVSENREVASVVWKPGSQIERI